MQKHFALVVIALLTLAPSFALAAQGALCADPIEDIRTLIYRHELFEKKRTMRKSNLTYTVTPIPGAPPAVDVPRTDFALCLCFSCYAYYDKTARIDFEKLERIVRNELHTKKLRVAFSGFAAGELLINTSTLPDKSENYYQIRVIAEHYEEKTKVSSGAIWIDVSKISRDMHANETWAIGDVFCATLENLIISMIDSTE